MSEVRNEKEAADDTRGSPLTSHWLEIQLSHHSRRPLKVIAEHRAELLLIHVAIQQKLT